MLTESKRIEKDEKLTESLSINEQCNLIFLSTVKHNGVEI